MIGCRNLLNPAKQEFTQAGPPTENVSARKLARLCTYVDQALAASCRRPALEDLPARFLKWNSCHLEIDFPGTKYLRVPMICARPW
jgi:hypothetical protein